MKTTSLFDLVADELTLVERELFNGLNSEINLISEVGNHILKSGGKRFRPFISLLVSRFFSPQGRDHIDLACALEYLHTATLLHDDVVDNGKVRRGSFTANSIWGDKISIVVGDFFLSSAFSLLVKIGNLEILKIFSETTSKMVKGESFEMNHLGNLNITEEDYFSIITDKTASLFSAACECSAILGKAPSRFRKALSLYGLNMGIAFQLIDDLLDYIGEEEELGKVIGKDLKEKKITLPLIFTLKLLSPEDKEEIQKILKKDELNKEDFALISKIIKDKGGFAYVSKKAENYCKVAKNELRVLPSSPEKYALLQAADYILERKS